jgi:tetratricopeptide (TPR) repeat protein
MRLSVLLSSDISSIGVRQPPSPLTNSFPRSQNMAFDKAKTLRAAERYLETGKIPAAIKEYSRIVESEPEDFTTLNILGDLQVRTGNQAAAISCFRRIAEHYRDQDFALKANRDVQENRSFATGQHRDCDLPG